MEPAPERLDQRLQDLIELIHLTEDVSVKLHGFSDQEEILRTVLGESHFCGKYGIGVLLLDADGVHLRAMAVPSSAAAEELRCTALQAGLAPLTQFAVDVDASAIFRPVIRDGRIGQHTVADVVREMFPASAADVILQTPGLAPRPCLLVRLQCHDRVIGALAVTSPGWAEYLIPSVGNLARHIRQALEAAQDRAERARLEAALRDREATLSALINATPDALFLLDHNGVIIAANEATAARFGINFDQIVGSKASDLLPPDLVADRRAAAAEMLRKQQPIQFEDRRGEQILQHRVYPVHDAEGRLVRTAVFSHDITELRRLTDALAESERRLRQMADVMPAAFWMRSVENMAPIYMSAAAERIFGYPLADFCQSRGLWRKALHPQDRDWVESFWKEHYGQPTDVQYRIVRPDGEMRWVRDVCVPLRDESGKLTLVTGFVEDITARKQAEARLLQSEKLSALGVLAGGIAHGLRNPLGVISACAQMLQADPADADLQRQCAERIVSATQRASGLVESVLGFARPQAAQMASLDLSLVVQHSLTLLRDHLLLHRVNLALDLPAHLPGVHGNAQLLENVFANLALNACNAMPEGGTLFVSAAAEGADWLVVRFRDTGHGILPEHLSKIFDPFFTTAPLGTGLGLTISRTIIAQHGGTIEVQSEYGHGATFVIRLPIVNSSGHSGA